MYRLQLLLNFKRTQKMEGNKPIIFHKSKNNNNEIKKKEIN